ncbi:hypothetical protein [Tabrizicola flagellatus]|uniref:hypothetical protein n=1 Tax=Tabrizicola flagellatus TaxID=2593021 RepID=UPI0011F30825|nr:hypothetical protein [Tabrizicola flagellatus]
MRLIPALTLSAMLAACASVNYGTIDEGTFSGEVAVVWLRGTASLGDGTFIYVPTPNRPLTFTRPEGETAGKTITPPMMYTDGGSVPGLARAFRGFTPWNYGPAYIVHDWVFMARQCLNAGRTDPVYRALEDLTFQDSAEIIAESIKALETSGRVKAGDISGPGVTYAVTSPFSHALWRKAACEEVTPGHRSMALEAVGRKPEVGDASRLRILAGPDGARQAAQAVVVAVSRFDE